MFRSKFRPCCAEVPPLHHLDCHSRSTWSPPSPKFVSQYLNLCMRPGLLRTTGLAPWVYTGQPRLAYVRPGLLRTARLAVGIHKNQASCVCAALALAYNRPGAMGIHRPTPPCVQHASPWGVCGIHKSSHYTQSAGTIHKRHARYTNVTDAYTKYSQLPTYTHSPPPHVRTWVYTCHGYTQAMGIHRPWLVCVRQIRAAYTNAGDLSIRTCRSATHAGLLARSRVYS